MQNYFFYKIFKTLIETQTSILDTVSNPSVEKEEEQEVASTRNEIIEKIQWQKQSSGKNNKKEPKKFNTKIDDLHELLGLEKTCKRNMPVSEKSGKFKGFASALVPEHVEKEFLN